MDGYEVQNIALKTLKQRCEDLQQRLNAVEEENCKLKLEKAQHLNIKTSKESNNLEERIIILNKEKSQMAHKIKMITTENFNLWSQLSKALPGNNISSMNFSVSAGDNQMLKFSHYDSNLNDYSKESLEEISLKLVSGIIIGKNELEKQYSQMRDLQKENIGDHNLSFTSKQIDIMAALKNLKDYVQNLKDFKQALYKQKNELSSAITVLKNSRVTPRQSVTFNNRDISNCDDFSNFCRENELNISQSGSDYTILQDSRRLVSGDEQCELSGEICPVCGKNFNEPFKDFYKHVSDHFDEENDEFLDAVSTSEVVQ